MSADELIVPADDEDALARAEAFIMDRVTHTDYMAILHWLQQALRSAGRSGGKMLTLSSTGPDLAVELHGGPLRECLLWSRAA